MEASKPPSGQFVFVCCQVGSEAALKTDVKRKHAGLAFAFSRPGFVTFKNTTDEPIERIDSPFARTFGASVTTIKTTENRPELVAKTLQGCKGSFSHLHVWERDKYVPGERQFEPFAKAESTTLGEQIKTLAGEALSSMLVNHKARVGDRIANLILIDDDHWFVGQHTASSIATCWPGGVPQMKPKEDMVSRAYLKMEEALRWSRLPIQKGDVFVELGSAPGGSCQALLDHGLQVVGIDPAIMDERVLKHPNFTHVRARAADLKRKEFADVRWLTTDASLDPSSTLSAVENIVTHPKVNIPGMLLTLKVQDAKMALEIDANLDRIRDWGYRHIRARQLAFNRREICVLAARSKGKMRLGFRR